MQIGLHSIIWKKNIVWVSKIPALHLQVFFTLWLIHIYPILFLFNLLNARSMVNLIFIVAALFSFFFSFFPFISFIYLKFISRLNISANSKTFFYIFLIMHFFQLRNVTFRTKLS